VSTASRPSKRNKGEPRFAFEVAGLPGILADRATSARGWQAAGGVVGAEGFEPPTYAL
jgi:hypothetical protein